MVHLPPNSNIFFVYRLKDKDRQIANAVEGKRAALAEIEAKESQQRELEERLRKAHSTEQRLKQASAADVQSVFVAWSYDRRR